MWDAESICCGSSAVVEHVISSEITGSEIVTGVDVGIDGGVVTEEPTRRESSVLTGPVETTPPQTAVTTPSAQPARPETTLPDTVLPDTALPTLQAVEPAAAVAADAGVSPAAPVVTPAVALEADAAAADAPSPQPPPVVTEAPLDSTAEAIIAAAKADTPRPGPKEDALPGTPSGTPAADLSDILAGDEPSVPTPVTPAAKKAANIFEEFADEPASENEPPRTDNTPLPADSAEPQATPSDDLFGSAVEAPTSDEPVEAEGVEPEAPAPAPAAEPDPFDDVRHGPVEPLRRWVDASGEHATVGVLVDLRHDEVEIRKANGRTVIVPLSRLSRLDRAYAAEAGARLAARSAAAQPTDTAGL